jgi:hypothetical protein
MKNITQSTDETAIDQARQAAWAQEYDALMDRLKYVKITRKYTRDEMNER